MSSLCPPQFWNPDCKRSRRKGARHPQGVWQKEDLLLCTVAQESVFAYNQEGDTRGQQALGEPEERAGLRKKSTRSRPRKGGLQLDRDGH